MIYVAPKKVKNSERLGSVMDKETKKVNFLLDMNTIAFLQGIKQTTGLNQSRALSMFVNRFGNEFTQELEKYGKKGETVAVSTFIE